MNERWTGGLERWEELHSPSRKGSRRYVCLVCGRVSNKQDVDCVDRGQPKPGSAGDKGMVEVRNLCGAVSWHIPCAKSQAFIDAHLAGNTSSTVPSGSMEEAL